MKYLSYLKFLFIPVVALCSVSVAFADEMHGKIELQHGKLSGYYSRYASSGFKLVAGSEYITLHLKEWSSSANKMELNLIPGKTANIRFNTFGEREQPGSCTIHFYNVTENAADYSVMEDTTKYGCGIRPYETTILLIDSVRPYEKN